MPSVCEEAGFSMKLNRIVTGDCREVLRAAPRRLFHCCVTSIPYYKQRDYKVDGQIGLESSLDIFIAEIVAVFRRVSRVLRDDGVAFVNIGDHYVKADAGRAYGGLKPKQRVGLPHRVAFALQEDGWYWRDEIVWSKRNPQRESATDRTCKAHEMVFMFTKAPRYFSDFHAVRTRPTSASGQRSSEEFRGSGQIRHSDLEKYGTSRGRGNNNGCSHPLGAAALSVWDIPVHSYKGAHFAVFPVAFAERCVRAGTGEKGCCPECGAAWRRVVEGERVPTRPGDGSKVHRFPAGWAKGPGSHRTADYNTPAGRRRRKEALATGNRDPRRHVTQARTVGWEPGCDCQTNTDTVPCRVLDPFSGAGTVAVAARKLGRDYLGVELNPDYAAMSRRRIEKIQPTLFGV
jgi:DNA modification methylase